jgi:hypothetical protein
MHTVYGFLGLFMILAGGSLLFYLGAGRVPPPVRPMANVWVRAGYDPKWITVAMWAVFAVIALVFFVFVGIPLYRAVVDLGTTRR